MHETDIRYATVVSENVSCPNQLLLSFQAHAQCWLRLTTCAFQDAALLMCTAHTAQFSSFHADGQPAGCGAGQAMLRETAWVAMYLNLPEDG